MWISKNTIIGANLHSAYISRIENLAVIAIQSLRKWTSPYYILDKQTMYLTKLIFMKAGSCAKFTKIKSCEISTYMIVYLLCYVHPRSVLCSEVPLEYQTEVGNKR